MPAMPEPSPDPNKDKGSAQSVQQAADAFKAGMQTAPAMLEEDPNNPFVYWHEKEVEEYETGWQDAPAPVYRVMKPDVRTKADLMKMFESWDWNLKTWFRNSLAATGVDVSNMNDGALLAYWERYIDRAAQKYDAGINMNPFGVLNLDVEQRLKWQTQDQKQPKTITQTSSQTQLSTSADARAIYQTAAQQLLGRDPTSEEVSGFLTLLNSQERSNPQITTTTSNYDAEGKLTTQSSVSEGGLSAEARNLAATDMAKQNPEYGAYQAATTYMDALKSMVYGRS